MSRGLSGGEWHAQTWKDSSACNVFDEMLGWMWWGEQKCPQEDRLEGYCRSLGKDVGGPGWESGKGEKEEGGYSW